MRIIAGLAHERRAGLAHRNGQLCNHLTFDRGASVRGEDDTHVVSSGTIEFERIVKDSRE